MVATFLNFNSLIDINSRASTSVYGSYSVENETIEAPKVIDMNSRASTSIHGSYLVENKIIEAPTVVSKRFSSAFRDENVKYHPPDGFSLTEHSVSRGVVDTACAEVYQRSGPHNLWVPSPLELDLILAGHHWLAPPPQFCSYAHLVSSPSRDVLHSCDYLLGNKGMHAYNGNPIQISSKFAMDTAGKQSGLKQIEDLAEKSATGKASDTVPVGFTSHVAMKFQTVPTVQFVETNAEILSIEDYIRKKGAEALGNMKLTAPERLPTIPSWGGISVHTLQGAFLKPHLGVGAKFGPRTIQEGLLSDTTWNYNPATYCFEHYVRVRKVNPYGSNKLLEDAAQVAVWQNVSEVNQAVPATREYAELTHEGRCTYNLTSLTAEFADLQNHVVKKIDKSLVQHIKKHRVCQDESALHGKLRDLATTVRDGGSHFQIYFRMWLDFYTSWQVEQIGVDNVEFNDNPDIQAEPNRLPLQWTAHPNAAPGNREPDNHWAEFEANNYYFVALDSAFRDKGYVAYLNRIVGVWPPELVEVARGKDNCAMRLRSTSVRGHRMGRLLVHHGKHPIWGGALGELMPPVALSSLKIKNYIYKHVRNNHDYNSCLAAKELAEIISFGVYSDALGNDVRHSFRFGARGRGRRPGRAGRWISADALHHSTYLHIPMPDSRIEYFRVFCTAEDIPSEIKTLFLDQPKHIAQAGLFHSTHIRMAYEIFTYGVNMRAEELITASMGMNEEFYNHLESWFSALVSGTRSRFWQTTLMNIMAYLCGYSPNLASLECIHKDEMLHHLHEDSLACYTSMRRVFMSLTPWQMTDTCFSFPLFLMPTFTDSVVLWDTSVGIAVWDSRKPTGRARVARRLPPGNQLQHISDGGQAYSANHYIAARRARLRGTNQDYPAADRVVYARWQSPHQTDFPANPVYYGLQYHRGEFADLPLPGFFSTSVIDTPDQFAFGLEAWDGQHAQEAEDTWRFVASKIVNTAPSFAPIGNIVHAMPYTRSYIYNTLPNILIQDSSVENIAMALMTTPVTGTPYTYTEPIQRQRAMNTNDVYGVGFFDEPGYHANTDKVNVANYNSIEEKRQRFAAKQARFRDFQAKRMARDTKGPRSAHSLVIQSKQEPDPKPGGADSGGGEQSAQGSQQQQKKQQYRNQSNSRTATNKSKNNSARNQANDNNTEFENMSKEEYEANKAKILAKAKEKRIAPANKSGGRRTGNLNKGKEQAGKTKKFEYRPKPKAEEDTTEVEEKAEYMDGKTNEEFQEETRESKPKAKMRRLGHDPHDEDDSGLLSANTTSAALNALSQLEHQVN